MRSLFDQSNTEELYDFFDKCMQEDPKLASKFRARFEASKDEDALKRLEEEIGDCLKRADSCRDNQGCMQFDMQAIADQIKEYAENGRIKLALSALEALLYRLDGLREKQGELEVSDEINNCVYLLVEIADEAKKSADPIDKDLMFEHCLKLVLSGFGSDEDVDCLEDILCIGIPFVSRKNRSKIENYLEATWPAKYIDIVKRFDGQKAADDYIQAHLDRPEIVEIAYEEAMKKSDYVEAERLIKTKLDSESDNDEVLDLCRLYGIYELTDATSKMIETAEIVLSKGEAFYYPKLKALLQASGEWEARYKSVLEMCERNLCAERYMDILKEEGEFDLLFEQMKKHPDLICAFGDMIPKSHRVEVLQMFAEIIRQEVELLRPEELIGNQDVSALTIIDQEN